MPKSKKNVSQNSITNLTEAEAIQKSQNSCSSALLNWESAGEKLSAALSAYLQSCIFLDTFSGAPGQDRNNIFSRVDISLNALHPNLFEELSQSRVVLARMRNKISSSSYSLPSEVLAEIFKDVVYTPGSDDKPFPSLTDGLKRMFERLHNILAVCSTWRNAAIELSELWSVIPVAHKASIRPTPKSASLILHRSRALTSDRRHLHLAAVLSDRHYGHIVPFVDGKIPQFTSINIEARFQSPTYYTSNLLEKFLESQSPSVMSELSIHHYEDSLEGSPPRPPKRNEYLDFHMSAQRLGLFKKLIGSLPAFRLRSTNIHWNTIPFSDKLVEIHLQAVMLGDNSKLAEFLCALASASELRYLKLVSVIAFASRFTATNSQISLPKLKTLLLDDLPSNVLELYLPPSLRARTRSKYIRPQKANIFNWGIMKNLTGKIQLHGPF